MNSYLDQDAFLKVVRESNFQPFRMLSVSADGILIPGSISKRHLFPHIYSVEDLNRIFKKSDELLRSKTYYATITFIREHSANMTILNLIEQHPDQDRLQLW